jgi:hypothetical protein
VLAVRSATSAGFNEISGWLLSEQLVGFNRNRRLLSSKSAFMTTTPPHLIKILTAEGDIASIWRSGMS